ncbi:DNA-binding protein [Bifidobacterium eulemuris]|uniref:DNA-binding protein n=2 Tax=Bifidobacterium eulemuris TaxID=1765219 RepID=A0A261GAY5_9BIFI|nr:helix-turn-helix transcriptional regulator [Bifidobacterium eulemuris]OZG68570.1 DNA-binding protein [Bifidobacterium eulemuris]QOL32699.1 helix-turn-helix transcriptional regulator [Bifidobacterium eulemuris]
MTMRTSLKLHRLEKDMKQSDLADLVNVRRETIGRLEQGLYCPSLRLAMDIAKVFDTTVEDLFSFDDEDDAASTSGKAA